jgi:hypothetical protein
MTTDSIGDLVTVCVLHDQTHLEDIFYGRFRLCLLPVESSSAQ